MCHKRGRKGALIIRRFRLVLIVGGFTLALVTCALPVQASTFDRVPDTGGPISADAPSADYLESQGRVMQLVNALYKLVDPIEDGRVARIRGVENGFASAHIYPSESRVEVFWKGAVPEFVRALLATDPAVKVEYRAAQYSLYELTSASKAIASFTFDDSVRLISTQPYPEENKLRLLLLGDSSTAARAVIPALEKLAKVNLEVRIATSSADPNLPVDLAASRQADRSPWWGGSGINIAGGLLLHRLPDQNKRLGE